MPTEVYSLYCDGAVKNNGKKNPDAPTYGGVGIVIVNERGKKVFARAIGYAENGKFGKKVTNNNMELMAVISGVKFFKKKFKNARSKKLVICSDSEYVVKGYNERLRKWIHDDWCIGDGSPVKNREYWEKILDLVMDANSPEIKFVHVKGHDGEEFNEIADKLAVRGKELAIKNHEQHL